jgi:multimeric flavodoxin WrbA
MKVIAFNSSPQMENGNTALILNPFLDGLREAGAEGELYYTAKLNIGDCYGQFSCEVRNGECVQNDDMQWLAPKIYQADIKVFATPLYADMCNASMKNLIDRMTFALYSIFFEVNKGHTRHPTRKEFVPSKVVLVSSCAFWEMDNFDPLVFYIKALCSNAGWEYAGALLRPHAWSLWRLYQIKSPAINNIMESAKEAGQQLVKTGQIPDAMAEKVSRELLPRAIYIKEVNSYLREHRGEIYTFKPENPLPSPKINGLG